VLAGLIVGGAVLWAGLRFIDPLAAWWHKTGTLARALAVVVFATLMAILLHEDPDGLAGAGIALGGGLGALLEERYVMFSTAGDIRQRTLRYGIGIALVGALFFGLRALLDGLEPELVFRVLRYGLVALFAIAGWPWLCLRVGLMEPDTRTNRS
jgi:hypothetical protein